MKIKVLFVFFIVTIKLSISQDVFKLLDLPKGYPLWAQAKNNDGTCSPSYNELVPVSNGSACSCGHYWLGCGAVAMGQIMYFWEWPYDYNWNIIPAELHNYTPNNSVDELQKLLYDCAEEMNMHYQCAGSWAYTNDLLDAFHVMGYESATLLKKSNWNIETWKKILRTELDVGRLVLIRGGEIIDWNDWGNVHYFVCDGYDRDNPDMFHFNLGWGNSSYTTSDYTCEIDHAVFGYNDYSNSQQIIIGVSPTCTQIPHYINSVPYSQVYHLKKETAFYNITLPQAGSLLTVENGGNLILTAGNKITLKSGFKAKAGSHFIAQIKNVNDCDCGG